jgi:hypothetical protein
MSKRLLLTIAIFSFILVSGYSSGAGAFTGNYKFHTDFSSTNLTSAHYTGGYIYNTNKDGVVSGVFGLGISDEKNINSGGFGGVISGYERTFGMIRIGTNVWAGIGGFNDKLSVLGEANLEVGLLLSSWFQIQMYGGIQGITPTSHFLEKGVYSPVTGVRIVFGSFGLR